jgi:acetyl esterase/lipase
MENREILERKRPPADFRISYGAAPRQFGDLRVPRPAAAKHPVAIVLHGGFWRARFTLDYMGHLCAFLQRAGMATWNLEFRSIGDAGGAWPGTFDDAAAGASHLLRIADEHNLDLARIVMVGHSAGGQLALWLASKQPSRGCVSLGGVADLKRAWELGLGDGVVAELLGGSPSEVPERYRAADPMQLLPLGVSQRLIHGRGDTIVPFEIAERYAEAAQAKGDDAKLIALDGGHFEPVDPETAQWAAASAEILQMVAQPSDAAEKAG